MVASLSRWVLVPGGIGQVRTGLQDGLHSVLATSNRSIDDMESMPLRRPSPKVRKNQVHPPDDILGH